MDHDDDDVKECTRNTNTGAKRRMIGDAKSNHRSFAEVRPKLARECAGTLQEDQFVKEDTVRTDDEVKDELRMMNNKSRDENKPQVEGEDDGKCPRSWLTHDAEKGASKDVSRMLQKYVVRSVVQPDDVVVPREYPVLRDNTREEERRRMMRSHRDGAKIVRNMTGLRAEIEDESECSRMLKTHGEEIARKDVRMPGPDRVVVNDNVVRNTRSVVRSVVRDEAWGGGGGDGCLVPDRGTPGGGDDGDLNKTSFKTKPYRVKGGLMARVQFWEVQTNKIQSGIPSEAFTNDDLGLEFKDRDRKEI